MDAVTCRVEGPALLQLVNGSASYRNMILRINGGAIRLEMAPQETVLLFVLDRAEYDSLPDGVTAAAASLTGEKLEIHCEGG